MPATLIKKRLWHRCFLWIFWNFQEHHFYRAPSDDRLCLFIGVLAISEIVNTWKQIFSKEFWTSRRSHQRCSVRKGVLRNFGKFIGKQLCQGLSFNKVAAVRPASLLKKRLWHRCFLVSFPKFLRAPFSIEHLWATASGSIHLQDILFNNVIHACCYGKYNPSLNF